MLKGPKGSLVPPMYLNHPARTYRKNASKISTVNKENRIPRDLRNPVYGQIF